MYKAIRQVEITFPLGSDSPGAIFVDPGETFEIVTAGRRDREWDVLRLSNGEVYDNPRYKDITMALDNGDLVDCDSSGRTGT